MLRMKQKGSGIDTFREEDGGTSRLSSEEPPSPRKSGRGKSGYKRDGLILTMVKYAVKNLP